MPNHVNLDPYRQNFRFCKKSASFFLGGGEMHRKRHNINFIDTIQPVHSEGDQPWDFFGRNDAKAETPVLWPPHAKS